MIVINNRLFILQAVFDGLVAELMHRHNWLDAQTILATLQATYEPFERLLRRSASPCFDTLACPACQAHFPANLHHLCKLDAS